MAETIKLETHLPEVAEYFFTATKKPCLHRGFVDCSNCKSSHGSITETDDVDREARSHHRRNQAVGHNREPKDPSKRDDRIKQHVETGSKRRASDSDASKASSDTPNCSVPRLPKVITVNSDMLNFVPATAKKVFDPKLVRRTTTDCKGNQRNRQLCQNTKCIIKENPNATNH